MESGNRDKIESITLESSVEKTFHDSNPIMYNLSDDTSEILKSIHDIHKEILESQSLYLTAEHNKTKILTEQNEAIADDIERIRYSTKETSMRSYDSYKCLRHIQLDADNFHKSLIKIMEIGFITVGSIITLFNTIIILMLIK